MKHGTVLLFGRGNFRLYRDIGPQQTNVRKVSWQDMKPVLAKSEDSLSKKTPEKLKFLILLY